MCKITEHCYTLVHAEISGSFKLCINCGFILFVQNKGGQVWMLRIFVLVLRE